MDPLVHEWLNLIVRWVHVITAIAWIGSSFYFNWLDQHLVAPSPPRPGVAGEVWSVHGGGFYRAEKYALQPPGGLPPTLHWFKWEAAFTWISGALLLTLVYYVGEGGEALARAAKFVALLAVGWFAYDRLFKSGFGRTQPVAAAAIGYLALVAITWWVCREMPGHMGYIHVGALVGTIMVANVWMIIIPAQRNLVEAASRGATGDADFAAQAKLRSLHNNYLTLPVVFIMISKNFASTFASERSWLLLAGLFLVGAAIRHWFNLRNQGRLAEGRWIWPAAGAGMVALFFVARAG